MAQTLLADPTLIRVQYARPRDDLITLTVGTISLDCLCPHCHQPSRVVHSHYARRVAGVLHSI
jgi:transposase-like protein